MLIGLTIRDVVLVEALDLAFGPGLTVLTGETGAGKSIILDALGLAAGARADAGLVRAGAERAAATAVFAPGADHAVWAILKDKELAFDPAEDLVLRRQLGADGRSRAFVNDQAVSIGVLRDLGEQLIEVHGQHETVGLLDARTHRGQLDAYAGLGAKVDAVRKAWKAWRSAVVAASELRERAARASAEAQDLGERLAGLDRLDPREGEEIALAEERALLGAAEKALADIAAAGEALGGDALTGRLSHALRALDRARERALQSGAGETNATIARLKTAAEAVDRALVEALEAVAAVDAAATAFDFEPGRLDKAEERLFALRAEARKLAVTVDALPTERARIAQALRLIEELCKRARRRRRGGRCARGRLSRRRIGAHQGAHDGGRTVDQIGERRAEAAETRQGALPRRGDAAARRSPRP